MGKDRVYTMEIEIKCKTTGNQTMLIDEEDYDKIKDLKLNLNYTSNKNTYYAKSRVYEIVGFIEYDKQVRNGRKGKHIWKYIKTINIHRLVMGLDDYKNDKRIIHHKDGNGLNNQKENLEICDMMYNSQSCRMKRNKGLVHYDSSMKRIKVWRAQITIMGVRHQKRFEKKEEAEDWLKTIAPKNELK